MAAHRPACPDVGAHDAFTADVRGMNFYVLMDALYRRLRHDKTRPLLQVDDPLQKLKDLYAVRHPLYRMVAHHVLETGRPSVATLVNHIAMQWEQQAFQTPAMAAQLPKPMTD